MVRARNTCTIWGLKGFYTTLVVGNNRPQVKLEHAGSIIYHRKITAMKNIKLILLLTLTITISSCKKDTNSFIVGTWTEISPCYQGTGSCFVFHFTNTGGYHLTSPGPDTGTYSLLANSQIYIHSQFFNTTNDYTFTNGNQLVLKQFYKPSIYVSAEDLTLIKNN